MIAVEGLGFTYPGATAPTLSDLSFRIEPGEVYGLLGQSGAGKSTTQRILMGLERRYSGSVQIFGQSLPQLGRGLYARIGVSFELPALYLRLTARENLQLFAALYDRPALPPLEVLAEVDLTEAADQRVEQFSKGMKMRLNLARALLHDPELLFLDEPTSGQDPTRARRTRELIGKLKARGKTVFLTTHNMAEADEICDRVGFLADGQIVETGRPAELRQRYGAPVLDVTASSETGPEQLQFPMLGLGENAVFAALLRSGRITRLRSREASLDDVFIRATGRSAAPASGDEE
jgi:fluoroquinolone transport system ATP-binding protein